MIKRELRKSKYHCKSPHSSQKTFINSYQCSHRLEATLRELQREKDTFLSEKEDLSSLLARRNDDLDRLTAELKSLTDQLVNASKDKSDALIKSEELDGKLLALEYK